METDRIREWLNEAMTPLPGETVALIVFTCGCSVADVPGGPPPALRYNPCCTHWPDTLPDDAHAEVVWWAQRKAPPKQGFLSRMETRLSRFTPSSRHP